MTALKRKAGASSRTSNVVFYEIKFTGLWRKVKEKLTAIQTVEWGRKSDGKVAEASRLFAEEGGSTAQASDSEGTRKRFLSMPSLGRRNGDGRCLAQQSSAARSGIPLCPDAANQVHATEREHDRVGEPGRDATFAFWSIFSGEPFR